MIAWARDKYPDDEIKDDNQADALALLEYAIKDLKLNQN